MTIYLNDQMCDELDLLFGKSSDNTYYCPIDTLRDVFLKWGIETPDAFVSRSPFSFSKKKKRRSSTIEVVLKHTDRNGWFEIVEG